MSDDKPKTNLLSQLEAQKRALDALYEAAKAAAAAGLFIGGDLSLGASLDTSGGAGAAVNGRTYTADDIPKGAFHGKSIPDAAKAYLDMVKAKQTTKEIADALRKGGIESTSDKFENMVYGLLNRVRANTGEIVRIGGKWGLAGWLAPSVRVLHAPAQTKATKKGKGAKKKRGRPTKTQAKTKGKPEAKASSAAGGSQGQVLLYMKDNASTEYEYSTDEIATIFTLRKAIAGMLLGKLVKAGKIEKTTAGKYRYRAG